MKLWNKLTGKITSFRERERGWEDTFEIVEDIGQCSCFPKDFRNEEDSLKVIFYKEFRAGIGEELYKKNRVDYWRECGRSVEREMQKYKYALSKTKKRKDL